jgi:hypothetical protein
MVAEELLAGLEGRGFRARLVSVRRLDDVRQCIQGLNQQGQFDRGFYEEWLAWFERNPPCKLPEFGPFSCPVALAGQERTQIAPRDTSAGPC